MTQTTKNTIQERMYNKALEALGEVEHQFDELLETSKSNFSMYKYLKQLGKTSLEHDELSDMIQSLSKSNFRINHNPNMKVFLYTIEQLEDDNNIRRTKFESELQHFLGLEYPFTDFSTQAKSNVNRVSYPEYIDICQPKYDSLRNLLVREGKKSSEWIINSFLSSEDVVVSNSEYFREKLRAWGVDPCGDNSGVKEE